MAGEHVGLVLVGLLQGGQLGIELSHLLLRRFLAICSNLVHGLYLLLQFRVLLVSGVDLLLVKLLCRLGILGQLVDLSLELGILFLGRLYLRLELGFDLFCEDSLRVVPFLGYRLNKILEIGAKSIRGRGDLVRDILDEQLLLDVSDSTNDRGIHHGDVFENRKVIQMFYSAPATANKGDGIIMTRIQRLKGLT